MRRSRRTQPEIVGAREAQRIAATLGSQVRATRRRRRVTQVALGRRVGVVQSRISEVERGHGASSALVWAGVGEGRLMPIRWRA
jgi:hypothetical protein